MNIAPGSVCAHSRSALDAYAAMAVRRVPRRGRCGTGVRTDRAQPTVGCSDGRQDNSPPSSSRWKPARADDLTRRLFARSRLPRRGGAAVRAAARGAGVPELVPDFRSAYRLTPLPSAEFAASPDRESARFPSGSRRTGRRRSRALQGSARRRACVCRRSRRSRSPNARPCVARSQS